MRMRQPLENSQGDDIVTKSGDMTSSVRQHKRTEVSKEEEDLEVKSDQVEILDVNLGEMVYVGSGRNASGGGHPC